jgi:PPPDE putative peptidase domain
MDLGFTELPEELFMEFLRDISPRFTAATYNLIKNNCNNFSDECAKFLIGEGIPKDIVELPQQALNTPLGRMLEPMLNQAQESLKVSSHQVFDNTGHQNPLVTGNQGGAIPPQSTPSINGGNPGAQMNDFINSFA